MKGRIKRLVMPNNIEIKRLTPKIFKFIEKIDIIETSYRKRWTEIQKVAAIVKQNKVKIFGEEKNLEGDGTEIFPVWDNISSLDHFINNNYEPFMAYINALYKELTLKNIKKIPILENIIFEIIPEFHNKVHKITEISDLLIDKEKKLYPNNLIEKNIPLIYRFLSMKSIDYINDCLDSLNETKKLLLDLISIEEKLLEEDNPFMEDLILSYYKKNFFSEAEEDELKNAEPPKLDDDESDGEEEDEDNIDDSSSSEDTPKANLKEVFDEDVLNIALYKLQFTFVIFKTLSTCFEQSLVLFTRLFDLNELKTFMISDSEEKEFSKPVAEDDDEDISDEKPPQLEDMSDEEKVNTDVTEVDSSDENF